MATDKDGVQIPDTVDAGNYVPLIDYGTNYRPTLNGATAFLGGNQELAEDDGITFKPQGYVPPSNRDGELSQDIPMLAKKVAAELAVTNATDDTPVVIQPVVAAAAPADTTDTTATVTDSSSHSVMDEAATGQ